MRKATWVVRTWDPDLGITVHGRYRWRWLAGWMSRGISRYHPVGGFVAIDRTIRTEDD